MFNLCYGMKVIAISQLPYGSFSHPNAAMDMYGSDSGKDFWFAQGRWKCIAGPWGNGTFFFVPVDEDGNVCCVHCADGVDRIVTIALTHSERQYIRTKVGQIYENGKAMYEEGNYGTGSTGNHIHYEVAEGIQKTKHYNPELKIYQMYRELNPIKVTFVNRSFSKVANSKGVDLPWVNSISYWEPEEDIGMVYFVARDLPCRIREKLTFKDGKPVGKILATMPKGAKAVLTHFTERKEKDGWEWGQVRYITPTGEIIDGYVQLDLQNYMLKRD